MWCNSQKSYIAGEPLVRNKIQKSCHIHLYIYIHTCILTLRLFQSFRSRRFAARCAPLQINEYVDKSMRLVDVFVDDERKNGLRQRVKWMPFFLLQSLCMMLDRQLHAREDEDFLSPEASTDGSEPIHGARDASELLRSCKFLELWQSKRSIQCTASKGE